MPTSRTPPASPPAPPGRGIPSEVFRAYDIRGIAPDPLGPELVHAVGWSIAREARELGETRVAVGRDGRLTGPQLRDALAGGLLAGGVSVVDMGRLPTPILYFAAREFGSGVMITGSHNPPDYNGLKITLAGETLFGERIRKLRERLVAHGWPETSLPDAGAGIESEGEEGRSGGGGDDVSGDGGGDGGGDDGGATAAAESRIEAASPSHRRTPARTTCGTSPAASPPDAASGSRSTRATASPGRPRPRSFAPSAMTSSSCTARSTGASRTIRPTPASPRATPTSRGPSSRSGPTSASRSTGTATGSGWWTARGRSSGPTAS